MAPRDYKEVSDKGEGRKADAKRKGDLPSLASCLMGVLGTLCSCCCCGLALFVILLLAMMGPSGWAIGGGCILVFLVVFGVIFWFHQFVIEGTSFNLISYFLPMAKYGMVSQLRGEKGVRAMWKSMEGDTPYVAEGFGPNTVTYFGWQEAYQMLSSWGVRIQNGTMRRHNELGLAIMGPGPWPETEKICLALSREDHAMARPYIAKAVDGGRVAEGPCDGSKGWNRTYLLQAWNERFDSVETFNTSDTLWWVTVIMHKIHANMDLSDEEAEEYMKFPSCMSFPGTGKFGVGMGNVTDRECCLFKYCTPLPCFQAKIQEHVDQLKDAIMAKWPNDDWDEDKIAIVASMFNDSLLYAGGLSVPSILQNMLAWWFMTENRPADLDRVTASDTDSIKDFMWECMRRNPPVAGVPRWITDDEGETWQHELANVEQAMQDERVFPDPMTFKMGRPGLCAKDSSRSMCWADFAIVNNDTFNGDSHNCPGKDLTVELTVSFWQVFLSREWSTECPEIQVCYNLTTTFDLTQV